MAYDRAQQIMLPQTGYFLSQPRINLVPSLQNAAIPGGSVQSSAYPRALHFSLPFPGYPDSYINEANPPSLPNYLTYYNPYDVNERDYQIITFKELEKMLPDPKPTGRVELGILPNGCAYAPKTATKENYLLFPSKLNYILYFTHHYFSRENLCRDQTFVSMLVNKLTLPLEKLIKAPRLAALGTTIEEVERALVNSKIVCFEDMGEGVLGVRRIDGYPCVSIGSDHSLSNSIDASYSTSTTPNSYVSQHASSMQQPRLKSSNESSFTKSDVLQTEMIDLVHKTGSLDLSGSDKNLVDSSHHSDSVPNTPSSMHSISFGQPVDCNAMFSQMPAAQEYDGSSKSLNPSQLSICTGDRAWIQPSVRQHTPHALPPSSSSNNSTEVASPSFANYAPIVGFHPRTSTFSSATVHPSELQNIAILPLRPAHLSHYFVGQPAYIQTPLGPYPQVSNAALSNFNLNMAAAAFASMNNVPNTDPHAQLSAGAAAPPPAAAAASTHPGLSSGYYANQFLTGGQFNSAVLGQHHQPSPGLVSNNQYQVAAIAAMAAASQQQQQQQPQNAGSPPYIHPHTLGPGQVHLPIYYAAQQYPLQQTSIPRHPVQRVPPAYPYPSYPMTGPSVDGSESVIKTDLAYPNNFAYPLILQQQHHHQQQQQQQPPTANKPGALSNLAVAAGLQLNCSQPMRSYGITPIPVNLAMISNSLSVASMTTSTTTSAKSLSVASGLLKPAKSTDSTMGIAKHDLSEGAIVYTPPPVATSPSSSSGQTGNANGNSVLFAPTHNNGHDSVAIMKQSSTDKMFPPFVDDSEDSTSSGIGDMNLASVEGGEYGKRVNSSGTLTEQQAEIKSTVSIHLEERVNNNT